MQASDTRARTHIHVYARICVYTRAIRVHRDGRLFASVSSRYILALPTRVPPFSPPSPPLSTPFIFVEAARRGASSRSPRRENAITFFPPLPLPHSSSPLPVHRQPSIEETKGKSFRRLYYRNTNVKNLCNFSRHRRPSG